MAYSNDGTIHMQQLGAIIQSEVDNHTRDTLARLSDTEKDTFTFANNIRDLLMQLQGMEKHFESSKDPLNLHAYEDELEEIQRQGQILCEDKLSPITVDRLPLTDELQLDEVDADGLWHLQNKLSMLAEELQNVGRRTTNQMADTTARHYQASVINAKGAENREGMAASAVRNQRTGG